jgi:predicted PurR-regulated permease PerM
VSALERILGRFLSSALVVTATMVGIGALVYFLAIQLTDVAVNVSSHSETIATKIKTIQGTTPDWLARIESGVTKVEKRIQPVKGNQPVHHPVAQPTINNNSSGLSSNIEHILTPLLPMLAGIAELFLVIVLFFFLLYEREDLHDRLVRLLARIHVPLTGEAIDTATGTISRYLLLFSTVNIGYGAALAVAMWALGLPNFGFWGALACLFRFIPYVGTPISSILPTLVAFAVFPSWSKSIEVFGCFIVLDQVVAQFVEPFLIGRGIGISPLALLVSAMFWSWLWGFPGLVLATPLTSCLKVAGDYIPELSFLTILLASRFETNEPGSRRAWTFLLDKRTIQESKRNTVHAASVGIEVQTVPQADVCLQDVGESK